MPATRTCDCGSCKKCHNREHARRVYAAQAMGRWEPKGDLVAVRAHLDWLRSQRVSSEAIHEATGISASTVRRIQSGINQSVTKHVADQILAVTPADGIQRLAVGTRRRIRALGRVGYSTYFIADQLNTSQNVIWELANRRKYVWGTTADRIAELYDRLSMTVGPSRTSIARATAKGWPSPLAWDNIDDPDEQPNMGDAPRGDVARWTRVVEDFDFLVGSGESEAEALARIGVQAATVRDYRNRLNRGAA